MSLAAVSAIDPTGPLLRACPRCGQPCRLVQSTRPDGALLLQEPDACRPHRCFLPTKTEAA